MTMTIVTLFLAALATARLTRLVTADILTEAPRDTVINWLTYRGHGMLAYLLSCPWCASMYIGSGVAAAWYAWGDSRVFAALCAALAFSHITGRLATTEGEH